MKQNALVLTRRGIFLFHWGLELYAGLILASMALGMSLFMFGNDWMLSIYVAVAGFTPYIQPVLQLMMIAGVMLASAAPSESRLASWAYAILLSGVVACVFRIAVYLQHWPMQWLQAPWLVVYLQSLLFMRLLITLCGWIANTERIDILNGLTIGKPESTGGLNTDTERLGGAARSRLFSSSEEHDVAIWSGLERRLRRLFWAATAFLLICVVFIIRPELIMEIVSFGGFGFLALTVFFCFLFLLARFSRAVYTINGVFRVVQTQPETADPTWEQIPADRIQRMGILLAGMAVAAIPVNHWAERNLAPEYLMQQISQAGSSDESSTDASVGQLAPEMKMTSIQGTPISLSELRGKVVILNFWATWCGPCVQEIPDLARLSREAQDEDVIIIGISDESADTLLPFVQSHEIPYSIVSGSEWPSPFDRISAIPATFVIDTKGVIRTHFSGSRSYDAFRQAIVEIKKSETGSPYSTDQ